MLKLGNVHSSIASFDEDEKVLHAMDTIRGLQEMTFLTETGVYRLVMRSNKPIARPFQKWVCTVVASIRENGRYVVAEEIEKYKVKAEARLRDEMLLGEKRVRDEVEGEFEERLKKLKAETVDSAEILKAKCLEDAAISCHENLVTVFDNREIVYIGKILEREDSTIIIKIGSTKNVRDRVTQLKNKYRGHFRLLNCFECRDNFKFERSLRSHPPTSCSQSKRHSCSQVFMMREFTSVISRSFARRDASSCLISCSKRARNAISSSSVILDVQ